MAKLYELSTGYKNIEYLIELGGNEEELNAVLNSLDAEIEDKAENIAKILKNNEADIEALKKEEDRLASRRRSLEKANKRLKDYLEINMKTTKKTKFKSGSFTFYIAKNKPSIEITNADIVSDSYKKHTETIDKEAILEDLKEGKDVQGAILKQNESLRIR